MPQSLSLLLWHQWPRALLAGYPVDAFIGCGYSAVYLPQMLALGVEEVRPHIFVFLSLLDNLVP